MAVAGSTVHEVKSTPIPMTSAALMSARASARRDAPLESSEPVGRVLQRPVGRQPLTGPGSFVDDAVRVGFHSRCHGLSRGDVDEECPDGLSPEVEADGVRGHGRSLRP